MANLFCFLVLPRVFFALCKHTKVAAVELYLPLNNIHMHMKYLNTTQKNQIVAMDHLEFDYQGSLNRET